MRLLVYINKKSDEKHNKIGFIEAFDGNNVIIALKDRLIRIPIEYVCPIDYYDGFASVSLERIQDKLKNKEISW